MIMMRMKNMVEGPTKRNCCSSAEVFFSIHPLISPFR